MNNATAPVPPAATKPGEKLRWTQVDKNLWIAVGARVKRMTSSGIGATRPSPDRFYVYRDGQYLGSEGDIDAAKHRAEQRIRAPRPSDDADAARAAGTAPVAATSKEPAPAKEKKAREPRAPKPPGTKRVPMTEDLIEEKRRQRAEGVLRAKQRREAKAKGKE
jgi:hypothetical protein